MRKSLSLGLLCALLAVSPLAAARSLGSLQFQPCTLPSTGLPEPVEALCTTLKVPENHAEPAGRQIELAIAWVPTEGEAEPDPVLLLAGGPGQAAREAFPQLAGAFREVLRSRHVILVDQRGTGASNPLACRDEEGRNAFTEGAEATPEAARRFAERCLAELSKQNDVRYFTTTDYIADLEAVRTAIGAEKVNLYGGSYGTRVGLQYAKAHPTRIRTLTIDSVVPNDLVLGSEHARNLDATLETQWARCAADSACKAALADPGGALAAVRAALADPALAPVRFRNPTSGAWQEERPSMAQLGILLRLYSYSPMTAAALPVILAQARDGDYAPLLAQASLLMSRVGDSIMHGMQLSVMCTEDAPELVENPADAGTLMGPEFVGFTLAQCAVWPRGERPANFRAPLTGDLPVLAISGELDPVTPPRYGDQAIQGLANARHLVLKGQGHTPLAVGCMPRLFAQFIEGADAKKLDAKCLDSLAALPPGTGLHGWEP
jgi:pimeloyl-ACP methyl ester carboxylesterase